MKLRPSTEEGFLVIELLISLLLVSLSMLALEQLLLHSRSLEQETEWQYRASLSAASGLTSASLSRKLALEESDLLEWQDWLAEAFSNSRMVFEKRDEKAVIKCFPPPPSKLRVVDLEN